jgi:hypothetical protein
VWSSHAGLFKEAVLHHLWIHRSISADPLIKVGLGGGGGGVRAKESKRRKNHKKKKTK